LCLARRHCNWWHRRRRSNRQCRSWRSSCGSGLSSCGRWRSSCGCWRSSCGRQWRCSSSTCTSRRRLG
jgi:hypothetical protein